MSKTSILIVTSEFPPQPGGIGDHAYNVAYHLERLGFHVMVIADCRSHEGQEEQAFDADLPFNVLRIAMTIPRTKMYIERIRLLKHALKDADVVLASGKFSLWSVAWYGKRKQLPLLAVVHGTEVNFKNKWLKVSINKALQQFDRVIAVSNYTKQLLPKRFQNKTVVIPNGVNIKKWTSETPIQVRLTGYPKLITVGHVSERKGQQEVIKQLPNLIKTYPEITYHCVGLPTEQAACEVLATQLGVQDRVFFHGRVSNDTLKALIQESDVFVMLSKETVTGDVEGFGIAVLEANALGIPAIGSQGCGISDAILDGQSGYLIPLGDSLAFESALGKLLKSPDVFKKQALAWAEKHHWDAVINQYETIMQSVIRETEEP